MDDTDYRVNLDRLQFISEKIKNKSLNEIPRKL